MGVELPDTSEQDWILVSSCAVRPDGKGRFKNSKSDVARLHRAVFHVAHMDQLHSSVHIYLGLLNIWKPIQLSLYSRFCLMKIV